MSRTSHARHERKAAHSKATEEPIEPDYADEHKPLVLIVIIVFLIVAPLFFAALSLFDLF